jgi:hypothetical protein
MGRAGIEPATLGLKVDAGVFWALGDGGRKRVVEPNQFGCLWVLWGKLVDLLLTPSVAIAGNAAAGSPYPPAVRTIARISIAGRRGGCRVAHVIRAMSSSLLDDLAGSVIVLSLRAGIQSPGYGSTTAWHLG